MTIDAHRLRSLVYPTILVLFLLGALGTTIASGLFIGREINTAMSTVETATPSPDLTLDIQTVRFVASHLNVRPSVTPSASPLPTTPPPSAETLPITEESTTSTLAPSIIEPTSTVPALSATSTTSTN